MTALEGQSRNAAAPSIVVVVLGAVIGLLLGLFGSIFGPDYPMAIGAALAIIGGAGISGGGRWSRVLLIFGIAVLAGATMYLTIGLLTPDGASSGSGSGCAPGGSCE